MDHCLSLRYGPHLFQLATRSLSCFMREDSAEEMSSPTTVLALVKAPLATMARVATGEDFLGEAVPDVLGAGAAVVGGPPVETLVLLEVEEVLSLFLAALLEVVMVVFPAVGGNLPPEAPEDAGRVGEEDIFHYLGLPLDDLTTKLTVVGAELRTGNKSRAVRGC